MKSQLAYIDEFGNNGLDFEKQGTSDYFIVSAIIIDDDKLSEVEAQIEAVRKKYFQTGEMKSSGLGKKDDRRLKILSAIVKSDFHIYGVVIDKRELEGEGFKFKGSFYKFLHSLVDRELFKTFPDLLIVADEHGGNEFQEGFIKYMKKRHIPSLFEQSEFKLSNSKSQILVQLADIIVGTLSRCYETEKLSPKRNEFLKVLKPKITEIKSWPNNFKHFELEAYNKKDHFDIDIANLGVNLAIQEMEGLAKSKSQDELDQYACLRYLIFHFKNINPESYVLTFELKQHLIEGRVSSFSNHYFRSKVIAPLRDKGVIIISSNKGYKLPSSSYDLFEYVKHSNAIIQPMIDRLMKCRNRIKLFSKNDIDILDIEEFKYLKILQENMH